MGEWRASEIGYLEPYATVCALCGQLVPARYWSESVAGVTHVFCDAAHAALYESYWLPRYGKTAPAAVNGPALTGDGEAVPR